MEHILPNGQYEQAGTSESDYAALPYVRPRTTPLKLLRQYRILLLTLLADYRDDWPIHVFVGLVFPIALVFFAQAIGGQLGTEMRVYLLGGNMAMSMAFGPPLFLMGKLGWARQNREFDYWISLPLTRMILMFAIVTVGLIFALPGLIGSYLLGTLLLGLPLSGGMILFILVPLGALSMTGVGVLIGTLVPNGQVASVCGNLLVTVVGFLSPMMIPLQNLPAPLQVFARFMPTTYIADAFRIALGGQSIASLSFDVGVLIITSLVLLSIAHWRLDWRIQ